MKNSGREVSRDIDPTNDQISTLSTQLQGWGTKHLSSPQGD